MYIWFLYICRNWRAAFTPQPPSPPPSSSMSLSLTWSPAKKTMGWVTNMMEFCPRVDFLHSVQGKIWMEIISGENWSPVAVGSVHKALGRQAWNYKSKFLTPVAMTQNIMRILKWSFVNCTFFKLVKLHNSKFIISKSKLFWIVLS